MAQTIALPAAPNHRADRQVDAWCCLRWMLVLALIFDLLSVPWHKHHHEGVDAPLDFLAVHVPVSSVQPLAQRHDSPPFVHAASALRVDLSFLGKLPLLDDAAPPALLSLLQLLADVQADPVGAWPPDASPPDVRSHRSLPPAGRAPPLHA